tara:strand:- start:579 stop:1952 length:1374 start_codon:yes stop_codon:yes gene_type:complete
MNQRLKNILKDQFDFKANKNQLQSLERLIFEIMRRDQVSQKSILSSLKETANIEKYSGSNKFSAIKNTLIERRYPLTWAQEKIDSKRLFLSQLRNPLDDNWQVRKVFKPVEIFVERSVKDSYLVENFRKRFPETPIKQISRYSQYLKSNKFTLAELKKPIVFIIKEKWDFLKPCPCTKHHLRCGYWIFNLGFGCPYDCSYCFLQQYTNFPGILLPANIDEFFNKFDNFSKKLKERIRIGTGEFCDSLALDHITEYSKKLIPYFKTKNVIFELKTKSANIKNILDIAPSKNIVISWSLNPKALITSEEIGAASLDERLAGARILQTAGYGIGFHFDPIIHSNDWQHSYKHLIDRLYSDLNPGFAWISLGTLRCNRQLKTRAELRFPKSNIFYSELLIGEDKKLRYNKLLRKEIYAKVLEWIRRYDKVTPIYLCMEDKELWNQVLKIDSAEKIEEYLIK